jgi:HK97 family phage portal protein
MSLLKEHYDSTRSISESKSALPDQIWSAMIWGQGTLDSPRWNRSQIITEAYEKNAVFFAAVNTLVNAVASMPLYVEVEVRGKKQRVDAHPILRVLERNEPYRQFMRRYANYYIALGTTYGKIVKDQSGDKPLGVIVMPAQFVRNIQGTYMKPIAGYRYTETKEFDIPVEDVIHAYSPSMSRYWEEMSPAIPLAEVISLHNAGIKWNKNIAQKGGIPAMIAEVMTRSKTEISKFKEWWQEQTGADRSHELKVVGEGTKFHNTAFRPNDTEWNNAILTTMRMILMTLGVSSSIMNDAANKTYNNVHDARKGLYEEGAIPILEILLGAITSKLQPFYADNPVIRIDRAKVEPIQEDRKMAIERLVKAVDAGIMTANEARTELGLQPAKGASADLLQNSRIINNIPKVDVNENGGSDSVDNSNDEETENGQ